MEKFFKIYRSVGYWIPLACIIICDELELEDNIRNWVWLILFMVNSAIIIISFNRYKTTNKYEKVLEILALILIIGYTMYFILFKII